MMQWRLWGLVNQERIKSISSLLNPNYAIEITNLPEIIDA
jgi:hypothetical protein